MGKGGGGKRGVNGRDNGRINGGGREREQWETTPNNSSGPASGEVPVQLTSNYHYILLFSSILPVLVRLFRRRSRPNAVVTNVTISWPPEMSPMLATEGESDQNAAHTNSRQCVEGAGAGAGASNDRKPTIRGAVGLWSDTPPNRPAF